VLPEHAAQANELYRILYGKGEGMSGDGDGWVYCALGHKHWGRYGAAGLLLRHVAEDAGPEVLLQHRAWWSHHGGTWGLPGGARNSHETAVQTALREAAEEAVLDVSHVLVTDTSVDDHGGWSYTTVLATTADRMPARARGAESVEVRWVAEAEVTSLPLHPGLAASWPRLLSSW
jgi:8-oxo-dGTP diphosphatase